MDPLRHVYLVGGCVRDRLLGLPAPDRDWVVVGETVHAMQARGFVQVGGTFPVFLHPETREEYALARQERKIGPGYLGFASRFDPDTTLEEDLLRRDLSINAMAMDRSGRIIDPFGGQKDLERRLLRHVSPAFGEDPLRVLRVARFMARLAGLGFRVAAETLDLMTTLTRTGELQTLAAERIWQETQKALQAEQPVAFFTVLQQCTALAVLFPELAALRGVPQPAIYHPEGDVWNHTCLALEQATRLSGDATVRFATLVHDLGKATTPLELLPHHNRHAERGVPLVNQLCDRLRVPTPFRRLGILAAHYHMQCHHVQELTAQRVAKLLRDLNALRDPSSLERFLLVCQADKTGRRGATHCPYPQAEFLRQCLQNCIRIDTQPLLTAGLHGKQLGEAIHGARLRQIRILLAQHKAAPMSPDG